ncbi:MAG: hypothetical protein Q7K37_01980 [Dehalococcoidia bacterium]|nr:hypothetical protein [Dehalococcoidia bacterium]
MTMAPAGRGAFEFLMAAAAGALVLVRVGAIVAVSMLVFLLSFFGYFVWPLFFVLIALGILGIGSTLRQYARLRTRNRRR